MALQSKYSLVNDIVICSLVFLFSVSHRKVWKLLCIWKWKKKLSFHGRGLLQAGDFVDGCGFFLHLTTFRQKMQKQTIKMTLRYWIFFKSPHLNLDISVSHVTLQLVSIFTSTTKDLQSEKQIEKKARKNFWPLTWLQLGTRNKLCVKTITTWQ